MKKAKSDESAGKKGPDRPKVGHTRWSVQMCCCKSKENGISEDIKKQKIIKIQKYLNMTMNVF